MKNGVKKVVFDEQLHIEAYFFGGISQPFPNHFHEHYVIGFVENGERRLSCKGVEYDVRKGSILLFNPGDNHSCVQNDMGTLDYRGLNISKETMLALSQEVTGKRSLPVFISNAVYNEDIACCLRELHEMVMRGEKGFAKEEALLFLISALIRNYGQPFESHTPECRLEIEKVCKFIELHYSEQISLEQLCRCVGLSKSTLLRAFTKEKGITPYRYLENVRVNEAKKLLTKGVAPMEAAMQTGFSDQSHFTNFFSRFIGLSPGVYRDIFDTQRSDRL